MWRSTLTASAKTLTLKNTIMVSRTAPKLTLINKPLLPQCYYSTIPVGSAKPVLPKFENNQKNNSNQSTKNNKWTNLLGIFTGGVLSYVAISYYLENKKSKPKSFEINYESKNLPGLIKPSKTVRAYLDYFGYSYDVVEVNSLTKKQLDWSMGYKGVPVLAMQIPSEENPGEYEKEIVQLIDSSVIVSALETFRLGPTYSLKEIVRYYAPIEGDKLDFNSKYFVMLHNENMNDGKTFSERKDEREWRSWVDSKFVHVISPNCYRTMGEAITTFKWFEKAGEWEKEFNSFERMCMIYVGAFVMYLIAGKLKKKYNLKENVRDAFDECSDEWTSTIDSKNLFRGGMKPNLADLALYGSMGSFEGCPAFDDMMKHDKIKVWYLAMRDMVLNSQGSTLLYNNTAKK